jgi:hypothetical protein
MIVNIMRNRESKKSILPNPGQLARALKTPERFWMLVFLLNQTGAPTVHEFAEMSDLSAGFVSKFANIMRDAGFLEPGIRLNLTNRGALLDLIRDAYVFESNQVIPYYVEGEPESILKKFKDATEVYALTKMCGSGLMAPFVRYQLIDFYIPHAEALDYWKVKLQLVDVEVSGNINIVIPQNPRILKQTQLVQNLNVVNSIQLYLDLYKYPARGREQAEYLREKVLKI